MFGILDKLVKTASKHRNAVDDIFLILSSSRPTYHKILLHRQLRKQKRLAARGALDGYPVQEFTFKVGNPKFMPSLYTEIFCAEPYLFETGNRQPLIIDGGVNIGMSVAYFKWQYPHSRVIGFEPHPDTYQLAKENTERNQMKDVTLVDAALTASGDEAELHTIDNDKASTLTKQRLTEQGHTPGCIRVNTVRLSDYVTEEVDFLKLDIEGAETSVLGQLGDRLALVRNMFVEYHYVHGDSNNRLPELLEILDRYHFVYLLASPISTRRYAAVASLRSCSTISSLSIFAKRAPRE